ncbi:tiny macrocysts protein B, partial [Haematococcus lacustris]
MIIWYSSFLIDVQGSYQSGYTELQNSKKASGASVLDRFCIFVREQEHTQKASAATSGDSANVDLDTLEPDAVVLAERIISAGKLLMPHQPYMIIWYSSFLIDVQGSYQSGYTELQNSKKASGASVLDRFCIFVREQEHTQKASAATSGDSANVDL